MTGEPLTGVSETALGAAMLRAEESARPDRLFDDMLAAAFVAAAPEIFADGPEPGDPDVEQLRRSFTDQLALRTRFYDDYVLDATRDACSPGCAVGRRTRYACVPARLAGGRAPVRARPARGAGVQADRARRQRRAAPLHALWRSARTWPKIGTTVSWTPASTPNAVTAWTAEGLLAYLSDEQAETLLVRVSKRSSPRSRFATEAARLTDDATLVEASTLVVTLVDHGNVAWRTARRPRGTGSKNTTGPWSATIASSWHSVTAVRSPMRRPAGSSSRTGSSRRGAV